PASVKSVEVSSDQIFDSKRFDAGHYSEAIVEADETLRHFEESDVEVQRVRDVTEELFRPSIHKRNYTDENNGQPYLTPTQLFLRPVEAEKYVQDPPEGLKVNPEWLLITCSGTVGRTTIADTHLEDFVISQNLIRTVPERDITGYLYAYLNSWMGQAYLTQDEYGATIKHINPDHVGDIPLPRLPEVEDEVHQKIMQAFQYREKADALEKEAIELLEQRFDEEAESSSDTV
ncbi:restriction endonuclease subunit S, partial [Halobiforma nitratireducens]|uniref:restriction endonuclease subunit S n=1 Tax=Halobiforma nitratireducens TaxID=130048 RepID=UPI00195522FA